MRHFRYIASLLSVVLVYNIALCFPISTTPGSLVTVSSDYTLAPSNRVVVVNAGGGTGTITITLPSANATGQELLIVVVNPTLANPMNSVTVQSGAPDILIDNNGVCWMGGGACNSGESAHLISDGAGKWYVTHGTNYYCENWTAAAALGLFSETYLPLPIPPAPASDKSGWTTYWDGTLGEYQVSPNIWNANGNVGIGGGLSSPFNATNTPTAQLEISPAANSGGAVASALKLDAPGAGGYQATFVGANAGATRAVSTFTAGDQGLSGDATPAGNINYTWPLTAPVAPSVSGSFNNVLTGSPGNNTQLSLTDLGTGFVLYNINPSQNAAAITATNYLFDVAYASTTVAQNALGARISATNTSTGANNSANGLTVNATATTGGTATALTLSASGGATDYEVVATGGTIRTSSNLTTTGTYASLTTANQVVLGPTATSITLNASTPVASRIYTIPDAGASTTVVLGNSTGGQTIAGGVTVNGGLTANGGLTLGTALTVGNGGTGTGTAFTSGSVVFADGSGVYTQNNTAGQQLFFDNTNHRLGIGTASPTASLDIQIASTTSAGSAPLKLKSGTLMTTPEAGAIEFDGTSLYYTNGSNARQTLSTGGGGGGGIANQSTQQVGANFNIDGVGKMGATASQVAIGTSATNQIQMKGAGTGVTTFAAGDQGSQDIHYIFPTSLPVLGNHMVVTAISGSTVTLGWGYELDNPGTFTVAVPSGITTMDVVARAGSGGGGAGGDSKFANGGGGGGGGGEGAYYSGTVTVTPGEILTVVVGAGGGRGSIGQNGSSGGLTSITGSVTGSIFSLNPGLFGTKGAAASPGSGGAGGARGLGGASSVVTGAIPPASSTAGQNGTAGGAGSTGGNTGGSRGSGGINTSGGAGGEGGLGVDGGATSDADNLGIIGTSGFVSLSFQ